MAWCRAAPSHLLVLLALAGCGGDGPSGPGADTTPPTAPVRALLEAGIPSISGGTSSVIGRAGAVERSAFIRITNVDATRRSGGSAIRATTTASSDGGFVTVIPARLGDELVVVAFDLAGNESAPTS
ncbi:MAG: hypothetical protein ABR559_03365, partial [Gemmatimonadota bacterium]